MSKTILVTGASGLVGAALTARLTQNGHAVVALRRNAIASNTQPSWDPALGRLRLIPELPLDAVVHLAGESIAQRWTTAARKRIWTSRVEATRLLAEGLCRLPRPPAVMVCASAIGFYGNRGEEILDEQSGPGKGFLPELCQAWEAASTLARQSGIRVVHLRFGIVLARNGGAMAKMLPAFRLGFGARLGNGKQYWSWITLEDLLRIIELALDDRRLSGAINTVAPEDTTNARFTDRLARALRRPVFLSVPAFAVRVIFGQMGVETLLASARVRPARLLETGFRFSFPSLDAALGAILAR